MASLNDSLDVQISVKWLIKIVVLTAALVGSYYNVQHHLGENDRKIDEMHEEIIGISARVVTIENEKRIELEETIKEQRTMLQKLGLKK
tara:strand:- start:420 stop:686 length:267 start_codon:yes stop_codon:yes gene_type:complete